MREIAAALAVGDDPIETRKQEQADLAAAANRQITFKQAMERTLATPYIAGLKSKKHRKAWRSTLETYAVPFIGNMPVEDVRKSDVVQILEKIWGDKPEIASDVRERLDRVFRDAIEDGFRSDDMANPASKQTLKGWMEKQAPRAAEHFPALPVRDVPAWWTALRRRSGSSPAALAFLMLTAARSSMVRGLVWSEIDLDTGIWTCPKQRMKGRTPRAHRVPLSPAAIALLKEQERHQGTDLAFPGPRGGMLSYTALSNTMRQMHRAEVKAGRAGWIDGETHRPAVPHGLRSTFKDWATENGYPNDMSEVALAHLVGDAVMQSYRRTDAVEQRRAMMTAWSDWCERRVAKADNVTPIRGAA